MTPRSAVVGRARRVPKRLLMRQVIRPAIMLDGPLGFIVD
jgi:hypothetical protein